MIFGETDDDAEELNCINYGYKYIILILSLGVNNEVYQSRITGLMFSSFQRGLLLSRDAKFSTYRLCDKSFQKFFKFFRIDTQLICNKNKKPYFL